MTGKAATREVKTSGRNRIAGVLLVMAAASALFVVLMNWEASPVVGAVLAPEERLERPAAEDDDLTLLEPIPMEVSSRRVDGEFESSDCEGGICGSVLDRQGVGLANVEVSLLPAWNQPLPSIAYTESLTGEELEALAKELLPSYSEHEVETRTDDEGRFRFDKLEPKTWRVIAKHPQYKFKPDTNPYGLELGSEVNFRALRRPSVEVSVYGEDGEKLDKAILHASKRSNAEMLDLTVEFSRELTSKNSVDHDWTREEPRLFLDPGIYTLTAYSSESGNSSRAMHRSSPHEVTMRWTDESLKLRFDLRKRSGIGGRVVALPGDEVPGGLQVHLLPLEPGQEVDLAQLAAANSRSRTPMAPGLHWSSDNQVKPTSKREGARASIDREGRFLFQDLEPGLYAIGASRNWHSEGVVHHILEVSDSRIQRELVLPAIDRSRRLHVSVFKPDGHVLDGVSFNLRYSLGAEHRFMGLETMGDTGGTYLLKFPETIATDYFDQAHPDALFDLDITHPMFSASRVELRAGQTELATTLAVPARLIVTVTGTGDPRLMERVTLYAKPLPSELSTWRPPSSVERPTRSGKAWTFARLEPGRCRVTLSLRRGRNSSDLEASRDLGAEEIMLRAGTNELEFRFDALESKLPRGRFVVPSR